ncbi:unnamed protein product [Parnassius apollo]|uniref:(apollo) hypothetical protein n=1 Tax=Parnassius apollo TaxID=110799 RepID=A0A8S3XDH6_PARAO|nr:unnamed protein product [Parnassius apollo]
MMEKKIVRKGPLPGGRQGASGAGAGLDSMRAASRARGVARPSSSPPHPSSPPEGLVSAGSSRTKQAAPAAGGARRMRWSKLMNANALRAYFRAKGEETGCLAYRTRMHRCFSELKPSLSVTEQNLADRVRYSCVPTYLVTPNSNDYDIDQKRLYKSLERPKVYGAGPGPDQVDTVAFWRGLWSEPVNHSESPWIEVVASQSVSVTPMEPVTIKPEDVAEAVGRAPELEKSGARQAASLLAEGVRSVSRCARPTVSRGSRSKVAPELLHYWDHSLGS